MRTKILVATVFLIFVVVCVRLVASADKSQKIDKLEVQRKTIDLKAHQLKGEELQKKLDTELNKDTKDQEELKKLQEENVKFQQETQELQKQLQAKLDAKEKARVAAAKAAQTVSSVVAPKASAMAYGSGCEWLAGRLAANGVSQSDIPAAINIARVESGCRQAAQNPGGACNVFQELPCGKWGGLGDIDAHIRGASAYAANRYNGWQGAWNSWQSKSWW